MLILLTFIFLGGVLSSCGTSEKAVDFQNMDSKTFLKP